MATGPRIVIGRLRQAISGRRPTSGASWGLRIAATRPTWSATTGSGCPPIHMSGVARFTIAPSGPRCRRHSGRKRACSRAPNHRHTDWEKSRALFGWILSGCCRERLNVADRREAVVETQQQDTIGAGSSTIDLSIRSPNETQREQQQNCSDCGIDRKARRYRSQNEPRVDAGASRRRAHPRCVLPSCRRARTRCLGQSCPSAIRQ